MALSPKRIFIHNDYNNRRILSDADLSLLELWEGKILINQAYINPICIWNSIHDPIASEGVVMGWGLSKDLTKDKNVAKLMKVAIQDNDDCFEETPQLAALSSRRTFCAGPRNGSEICSYNTGAGLFIKIDGVYFLKGLVSMSLVRVSGNENCATSKPAVYTNVQKFFNWIKQTTRGSYAIEGD